MVLDNPTVSQFVVPTVTFAVIGAARTLVGAKKNSEDWKWAKGQYEIIILTLIGAFAGMFSLMIGVEIGGVVFGSIALAAGVLVREGMKISGESLEHYQTLVDRGVHPRDAAVMGIQHGMSTGDSAEVAQAIETLLGHRDDVSRKNVSDRGDAMTDAYREGGTRAALDEVGGVDDIEDELRSMASEGLEDGEDTDDSGPVVVEKGP